MSPALTRAVATCAWLAAILPLIALVGFAGAYDFDVGRLSDLPSIVGTDRGFAIRIAGLLDMTAYLVTIPVVLYLHRRFEASGSELLGLATFCGLAYAVLGSLGGSTFATVAPPLIDDGSEAARVTFAATTTFVTVTIWSTLESIFLGVWLLGVNRLLRRQLVGLGTLGMVAGVGALLTAVRSGLTGQSVADLPGPVDLLVVGLLGLYVPWFAWLGVELFRAGSREAGCRYVRRATCRWSAVIPDKRTLSARNARVTQALPSPPNGSAERPRQRGDGRRTSGRVVARRGRPRTSACGSIGWRQSTGARTGLDRSATADADAADLKTVPR